MAISVVLRLHPTIGLGDGLEFETRQPEQMMIEKQKAKMMNKSKIKELLPELMPGSEQKANGLPSAKLLPNPLLSAVYLFLDDIREPSHAFEYTKQKMFVELEWEVVRNYNEFVNFIQVNGLPKFISFDHDLADSHYTPEPLWTDYDKSKEWQDKQVHNEKTGYECAKWLVDYCIDNNLKCPQYYCHSMNPVGKDKIVGLLGSFSNSR